MIKDSFGQMIFTEEDLINQVMIDPEIKLSEFLVDQDNLLKKIKECLDSVPKIQKYQQSDQTVAEFDQEQQSTWHMPDQYAKLDIAEYVLKLCNNEAELQRCGGELILYQEHGLFDLLRYLHYLVDDMRKNHIIWGVGRGSSTASYILYKLGVHKIDSMFYQLDIQEFLR